MSQMGKFINAASIGAVGTLTGNVGGAVSPDGVSNIDVVGSGAITVTGNPAAWTLTITVDDATTSQKGAVELATDAEAINGTDSTRAIVPTSLKAKLGVQTSNAMAYGGGTTGVIGWTAAGTDGQIIIAATGSNPDFGSLTSTGSTITVTGGANTLNIETGATVPVAFPTDSGTATPAGGSLTISGGNDIATSGAGSTVTVAITGTTQYGVQVGDATGGIDSLAVGTTNTVLLGNTGGNPSWGQVDLTTDVTGILPVANGGTGNSSLTDHGIMLGSGAGAVTVLAAATNGQIPIGSTGADPVLANITSSEDLEVTNGAGTIDITLDANTHTTTIHGWDGAIIETAAVTVTSDGATITFSVEQSGGGDLTVVFSDGFYDWDTTPADTISLTAGTDTSPQINYVYFLQSTKALTVSTVGFPSTEHAPLATVLCQSAASLQTDGAYKVHAWTDHIVSATNNGHISHLNAWIRAQNATWQSGVAQTLTITPNGGAPDNVIFTSTAGVVLQLHDHTFPAFAGTPDVYTVNDSVTPYNVVTDLNALLTDSAGGSMSGRYFTLVIWGVVSEATGDCKLMVNLPGGSYGTQAQAESDSDRYTNYTIPGDFTGTGFLIYEMLLRHQVAASGTWTSIREIDLRGLFPGTAAGGSTSAQTEFEDNTFRIIDDGDNTKELAFQISPVTTATTRTITMDDRDIDLDAVPDSFPTDSGTGTPAAGVLTVAGGTGINTSASGSTVTITATGAVSSEFDDSLFRVFDDGDNTKKVAFQCSGITTSTVRTWTVDDRDIDFDAVPTSASTDSGSAVPAAGVLTVAGGDNIDTSGAGSTVTIAVGSAVCDSAAGDSGTATPAAGVLTIAGGTNITTSAAGSTVTINSSAGGPEFADDTFRVIDDGDNTKKLAFQASGITTATTRTWTIDDRDIDFDAVTTSAPTDSGTATPAAGVLTFTGGDNIDTSGAGSTVTIAVGSAVCDSAATDSGTATPSAGVLTFAGGTNVTTSGSGSTVTINSSGGGGGLTWNEVTGTSQSASVDNGYITNNASLVTVTLPDTAALGSVVRICGKGAGGWKLAQNASESIIWDEDSSTTTGTGGSLQSTDDYDAVEVLCTVANTTWTVISSKGNITVV